MAGETARAVATRRESGAEERSSDAEVLAPDPESPDADSELWTQLPGTEWRVFHDVRWPGRRFAIIDHVLVGPQGVFVIDTLAWTGKVDVRGGVLRQNGRRRSKALIEAAGAAEAVRLVVPWKDPEMVKPVVCFVRQEPVFGWAGDVMVCSTKNVVTMLTSRPKVMNEIAVRTTAEKLAQVFRSATSPVVPLVPKAIRRRRSKSTAAVSRRSLITVGLVAVLALLIIQLDVPARLGELGANTVERVSPPSKPMGETFTVAGAIGRPPLVITAGEPVLTRSATPEVRLGAGHQLLAVPMTIRNAGDASWDSQGGTRVMVRDQANVTHRVAWAFTKVTRGGVLPTQIRLRPGRTIRGLLVFDVAKGTKIEQVTLTVGPGTAKTVRWSTD